jgi:hypothetical protein
MFNKNLNAESSSGNSGYEINMGAAWKRDGDLIARPNDHFSIFPVHDGSAHPAMFIKRKRSTGSNTGINFLEKF